MMRTKNYLLIALTLLLALALTIVPLPEWARYLRPQWVMLVVIFWTLVLPENVGVGMAWIVGLLLDALQGAVLGQYALCMSVVAYLTYKLHYQLRMFPLWQQAIAVFLFMSLAQLLLVWINALMGQQVLSYWTWVSVLISALLWPWMYILLHAYQQHYRIQ